MNKKNFYLQIGVPCYHIGSSVVEREEEVCILHLAAFACFASKKDTLNHINAEIYEREHRL